MTLVGKEVQSNKYAEGFPEDFQSVELPLPFVYESTGVETIFTNLWDSKPRSRDVFNFHRPETFEQWIKEGKNTLRKRLTNENDIDNKNLWSVQRKAISNVEESLAGEKQKR